MSSPIIIPSPSCAEEGVEVNLFGQFKCHLPKDEHFILVKVQIMETKNQDSRTEGALVVVHFWMP